MLSVKSIRIMNRFAVKILCYKEIYARKVHASGTNIDIKKQKTVNVVFAVLLALFNDLVEVSAAKAQLVRTDQVYEKFLKLKVRKKAYDVPNLTSFLAYKNDSNYVDVKRLATATDEFMQNQYLKSFGTIKKKSLCLDEKRSSSLPNADVKRTITLPIN